MAKKPEKFSLRLKVWIENEEGELVFGGGRIEMLEAISQTGSINKAAKELRMSYRALWGRLVETEKRLGKKLLVRSLGGAKGGGSMLTPLANDLIKQFRSIQLQLEKDANRLFKPFYKKYLYWESRGFRQS